MKIISDHTQDTKSPKPIPGSYEWWYFDAVSDDGNTSLVIIFYEGNPFSRRYIEEIKCKPNITAEYFPAISLSVYHKGKPVYYGFEELAADRANFSSDWPEGNVGDSWFRLEQKQNELIYHVYVNHLMPNGDALKASLKFRSPINGSITVKDENLTEIVHSWNLIQPAANVKGLIKISGYETFTCNFNGTGYHDHNMGEEPMREGFDEWYWGRFHTGSQTLVYYLMNRKGDWTNHALLFDDSGKARTVTGDFTGENQTFNLFGLKSYRKLVFQSDSFNFTVQQVKTIDNGPFYQRFLSRVILHTESKIIQGRGISEYIYPARIYSKYFWPLVNMRIQYPDNIHWVQKSPKLYRWTW